MSTLAPSNSTHGLHWQHALHNKCISNEFSPHMAGCNTQTTLWTACRWIGSRLAAIHSCWAVSKHLRAPNY
jgi:hypothetical protein